jgi:hypothetical protein
MRMRFIMYYYNAVRAASRANLTGVLPASQVERRQKRNAARRNRIMRLPRWRRLKNTRPTGSRNDLELGSA